MLTTVLVMLLVLVAAPPAAAGEWAAQARETISGITTKSSDTPAVKLSIANMAYGPLAIRGPGVSSDIKADSGFDDKKECAMQGGNKTQCTFRYVLGDQHRAAELTITAVVNAVVHQYFESCTVSITPYNSMPLLPVANQRFESGVDAQVIPKICDVRFAAFPGLVAPTMGLHFVNLTDRKVSMLNMSTGVTDAIAEKGKAGSERDVQLACARTDDGVGKSCSWALVLGYSGPPTLVSTTLDVNPLVGLAIKDCKITIGVPPGPNTVHLLAQDKTPLDKFYYQPLPSSTTGAQLGTSASGTQHCRMTLYIQPSP